MSGLRQTRGVSLEGLRDRIADLRSPAFRARLAQQLGEEARTQVADCFREERDPYGRAWEPLKYRKGKILRDTGRMAAAVAVQQTGNGFRIDIPVKYAPVHQYGAIMKAHRRAGGILVQDARGRFVSKAKLARQL
jgi:phage virion morphogenesis protein